jgi:integrase
MRNHNQPWLVQRPGNGIWIIRFVDEAGRTRQKSTGSRNKREAERQLGALSADLDAARYEAPNNLSWAAFRLRYDDERLLSLATKTRMKVDTILDAVERILNPQRLRDLTSERISKLQAELRKQGLAESTIAGYLAHLRAALSWAVDVGLLHRLPKIQKPRRAKASKVMKGRPITEAEFNRMLAAVVAVVGDEGVASWQHYLRGLYLSGLRLAESLELFWDNDAKLCIVFESGEAYVRVPAELEKGNKDRLLPLAPDFTDLLLETPEHERSGRVFQLKAQKRHGDSLTADRVTRIVAAIGRKAGVLVDQGRSKYASAHDLRRSFGERWAAKVMPQVLMELMRHESIETTLRYYVGRNAQRTTRLLREAYNERRENDSESKSRGSFRDTPSVEDRNAKS